ncbi:ADP/ATP carrier protein family protein [Luteitalea pratensis]|uniref:ADP,ATP carrier protein n=1 Tax=Luteitalea pratensis TaxID=1855912 RepID=A0A143PU10_LUTPR|nr:Npt1/Npt2 family nucleotide transporter [Luteitalea pratensis]AMY11309.1 ADP/ATP carrier protein family protein [Luteitalea pratensis]
MTDKSGPLRRLIDVRPGETAALLWASLFYFSVLFAYYVIRPIRDAMGAESGVEKLPWLFTGTLIAMLLVNPPYAALVSRLPRLRFISVTYRFFQANLLVFFALFLMGGAVVQKWAGGVFFVWTSVFNLFVVSVFWAFLVDVFSREQGKRLFGFIAAGATVGALLGSSVPAFLAERIGATPLLLVSVVLLEIAVLAMRRLSAIATALQTATGVAREEAPIGGGMMAGVSRALSSPYLLNVAVYMLLYTFTSTVLYFQQVDIAAHTFSTREARTAFFGRVDLAVNALTLLTQLFLTSRILKALGVALTLSILPLFSVLGFGWLGMMPTITAIVALQVTRRAGNFAIARPTRELLFTVLSREDKYKAKSFIDTAVYRLGDQVGAWSYTALGALGLALPGIALYVAVPVSAVWLLNAFWLGRRQEKLARAGELDGPAVSRATAS